MDHPRAQRTLPFDPPVQRESRPAQPEPEREVGMDLTAFLFDEFTRRAAAFERERRSASPPGR